MRVLLTTDTVGGVWTFTKELTERLVTNGHSIALVSFGRPASAMQMAWVNAMAASHPDQFLFRGCDAPLEWMQDNDLAWARGAELLMDLVSTFRADILHSNQFCWGALPLTLPKLITAHSDVRSWAAACRSEGLTASAWLDRYDFLVQQGIDGADAIISPTAWMRDALCKSYEVSVPYHVIPNGRTLASSAQASKRELRAVSVGRLWDEGKGLAILGETLSPMPIFLAGEPAFEGIANTVMQPLVNALGILDEKSLFDLFFTSSVYLATSLYEPFGLAPLEAALCGCAVLARDLPSLREVWGEAALYFGDGAELQSVLTELVQNPNSLRKARNAAAERARHFPAEQMVDEYASLYRRLMSDESLAGAAVDEELHAA